MQTRTLHIKIKQLLDFFNEPKSNNTLKIFSFITFLTLSLNLVATSTGVLSTYFNIPWTIYTFGFISILSIILSFSFSPFFPFENYSKLLFFLAIIGLTAFLYGKFNPVIEIRQDPSVYAFNAFNLINHGTIIKPLYALSELIEKGFYSFDEWKHYAKIFNGTQLLVPGQLHGDFFPGATYVYACLGLLNKSFVFYGPAFVMISVCISLYFIIYKILNEAFSACLLTFMFLLSPIMTWFGRAFYAGPFALLFFLLILYLLIDFFDIQTNSKKLILLILLFSLSYFSRLEMFIVLLLAVYLISYKDWKFGLLMLFLALLVMNASENNYSIYYNRIGNNEFTLIFTYWTQIVCGTYLFSLLMNFIGKRNSFKLENIIFSRTLFYSLLIIFTLFALLCLRNDFVDLFGEHQLKSIHGNIMRTYNEENLDRIFMVFPAHIFIIGICYLAFILKKQSVSLYFKVVLFSLMLPNLIFLYEIHNSPMLYWAIRRYIPIVLPVVFLGFIFFLKDLNYQTRIILVFSSLLIMTNIFFEARQRRDYKGLDLSVRNFTKVYHEDDNYLFIYHKDLRYLISSFMSYGKYDFLPINSVSEMPLILPNIPKIKKRKIMFVSKDLLPIEHQTYSIDYQKVGENYQTLPKKYYHEKTNLYLYDAQLLANNTNSLWKDGILWPNLRVHNYSGLYGKGWTNGNALFEDIGYELQPQNTKIIISRTKSVRIPHSSKSELGLRIFINGIEADFDKEERELKYYFFLPNNIKSINTLKIKSNTFVPKELGFNQDTRKLGIHIHSITIE